MCLYRGCGKRRSQNCQKCEEQDKVKKRGNLLPELVAAGQFLFTVCNQEAGHPGKLATDFLQLLVLHEISKKLYHWKA